MDDGDKGKLEAEMMNQGPVSSYQTPTFPSEWPCGNVQGDLIPPLSYVATVWENHPTSTLEFNGINAHSSVDWQDPNSLPSFAAMNQSISPYDQLTAPMYLENTRYTDQPKLANSDESDSGDDGCQEDPSPSKECRPKKRKRGGKDAELEQSQQLSGGDGDATDNSKHSSPLKPKEDYIHVRARRGQATNSHSLAERVRREKIRERMKLLQDLVPGCSKVTGKAVMLDEIINYVQALQRQVEFLSMKLATVDPRTDFSIDSGLAKEQMFATRAGPSSLGLSSNTRMAYPFMNPSQPSLSVIGSSSDALRNLQSQFTSLNEAYKEPTPQMPNVWDDELQNVVQMGFSPSAPLNQDTPQNTAHMKAEL